MIRQLVESRRHLIWPKVTAANHQGAAQVLRDAGQHLGELGMKVDVVHLDRDGQPVVLTSPGASACSQWPWRHRYHARHRALLTQPLIQVNRQQWRLTLGSVLNSPSIRDCLQAGQRKN